MLVTPPGAALLMFFVLPLIAMLLFSFREGTFSPEREMFTLRHVVHFLEGRDVQRLLWESALTSAVISTIAVTLAYPLAYYLAFGARERRNILLLLVLLPAMTSYLLRVMAWKIILGSEGLLNTFLIWTGVTAEGFTGLLHNRNAVIVTLVYVWVPFAALPIFASLMRIDTRLFEGAADLGARPWETFGLITLPLSLPGIAGAFLFVFVPTLGEWVTPMLVGGTEGVMFGNIIQDTFTRGLNWPLGSVMSLAMISLTVVLLGVPVVVYRSFRKVRTRVA